LRTTPEEDVAVHAGALRDPDNPPLTISSWRSSGEWRTPSPICSRKNVYCMNAFDARPKVNEPRNTNNPSVMIDPAGDDSTLLALERQFNEIAADLLAAQCANDEMAACSAQRSSGQSTERPRARSDDEAGMKQVEAILARLYPIEQAIMHTPACTIAGLGVKARHAAYVTSQYWSAPIDRIDWDAQAVRLLIEAVCNVARMPLPFSRAAGDTVP
jgi:hypothetical protein